MPSLKPISHINFSTPIAHNMLAAADFHAPYNAATSPIHEKTSPHPVRTAVHSGLPSPGLTGNKGEVGTSATPSTTGLSNLVSGGSGTLSSSEGLSLGSL
jgi:hypothetical protein